MKTPTPEQMRVLRELAARRGKSWKNDLMRMWLDGSDANQPEGHLLRQVRNQLGPTWLNEFKEIK